MGDKNMADSASSSSSSSLSFNDLRKLCKSRGLSAGGTRVQLLERLREHERVDDRKNDEQTQEKEDLENRDAGPLAQFEDVKQALQQIEAETVAPTTTTTTATTTTTTTDEANEQTRAQIPNNDSKSASPNDGDDMCVFQCGCMSEFVCFVAPSDLVSLVREKTGAKKVSQSTAISDSDSSSSAKPATKVFYDTWLNSTTIDAIVLCCRSASDVIAPADLVASAEDDDSELGGDENDVDLASCVYLGSGFNYNTLKNASAQFIESLKQAVQLTAAAVMVLNLGQHWVLLSFEKQSGKCLMYDPMASSNVNFQVLLFAARVWDRVEELESKSGFSCVGNSNSRVLDKSVSVRTQLPKYDLSFFEVVSVGAQLKEEEGYNCGMYCALWARAILFAQHRRHFLRSFSRAEMNHTRALWQRVLFVQQTSKFLTPRAAPAISK